MKTCLIIDDSDLVREITVRIVTELGLKPAEAISATEGVEICRGDKPDVVLLDWDLPSMGALDFLRGVGGFVPEDRPAIVLCATENDPQQFSLAKAAGAAHHILKPFDRASIEACLVGIGVIEKASIDKAGGAAKAAS